MRRFLEYALVIALIAVVVGFSVIEIGKAIANQSEVSADVAHD